jgi:membrane protein implicated in regulation of membrane protease activity
MCHLILLMPVFALAVFWIWPLAVAAPIYAVVSALSLWMYALVWQAMRRPVLIGAEELVHSTGEVMEVQGKTLRVRVHSEMWNAESRDSLRRGDRVQVIGITGLTLRVRRGDDAEIDAPKPARPGSI